MAYALLLALFAMGIPAFAQEKTKDHADEPKPKVELSPRLQAERQNKSAIISSRVEGDDYAVRVKMRRIKRFQLKMAKRSAGRAMARRERQRMMQLQSVTVRDAQRGGATTQTDKAVGGAIKHVRAASTSSGRTLSKKQYKDMLKVQSNVQATTNKGEGDGLSGGVKRAIAAENSAEIANRAKGRTMARPLRQRMMAFQNSLLQIIKGDDYNTPEVRKFEAADRNAEYANFSIGDGPSDAQKRFDAAERSSEFANFSEGDGTTDAQKRFEAAERSVDFSTFIGREEEQIEDVETRRLKTAQRSAELANYAGDQIESHNEIEYFEADQSRRHAYATQGNTMTKPDYKAMLQAKSKILAEATKGNTMTRPDYKAMMQAKSKKVAEATKGNTMTRPDYKAMVQAKSKKLAESTKGNTMTRPDYKAMVQAKSKKLAEGLKGNTLLPIDHIAMMKAKSGKMADIGNAGYLNSKTEKDLRLQRLLHPNAYLPNNPKDKADRQREKSKAIASFDGKFSRKDNKNVLAHNSAIALNAKNDVTSYGKLDNARRKGARKIARDKKRFLPQFLRKKEEKPKFADVEKGIWYD